MSSEIEEGILCKKALGAFMDIINTNGSIRQIDLLKPLYALLISDHHFSDKKGGFFSVESTRETLKCLSAIIKELQPNQIFVLGDLFNYGQQNNRFVSRIMSFFSELEQEVFLIGGNHDRILIENQIGIWSGDTFHIYSDYFLVYRTSQGKIWFTHDGNNPHWLDISEVPSFIRNLKKAYKIPKQHWLILGHTHLPCLIKDRNVASLGCFNVEGHNQPLSYGVVKEISHQILFSLRNAEKMYSPKVEN